MRTPLAWKNLTGDVRRLVLGSVGVGFAVILMFVQNGFRNALLDSPIQLFALVDCDLVASSSAMYTVMSERRFSDSMLLRARSRPEVEWAEPLYFEKALAKVRTFTPTADDANRPNKARSIRVLATTTDPRLYTNTQVAEALAKLRQPMAAVLDQQTNRGYGFLKENPETLSQQRVELMDQRIKVVDSIRIGTDFANDGNLLLSTDTFARCFPFRGNGDPLSVVDFAFIRLKPEFRSTAERARVASELTALNPQHWTVYTKEEFTARESDFWNNQTPIGYIFSVGVLMGFTVGVIVCYQILYTNIQDSMSELATLKAMGYSNRFFLSFVIQQAFYLSILGFIPATAFSYGLFLMIEYASGLPMALTPSRILWIYLPTLAMCVLSGMLAVRKLWQADPASLF